MCLSSWLSTLLNLLSIFLPSWSSIFLPGHLPSCTSSVRLPSSPSTIPALLSVSLPGHLLSWPFCTSSFQSVYPRGPSVHLSSRPSTLLALLSFFLPGRLPSWPFCPSSFQSVYPPELSVHLPVHLPSWPFCPFSFQSVYPPGLSVLSIFQSIYPPGPYVRLPPRLSAFLALLSFFFPSLLPYWPIHLSSFLSFYPPRPSVHLLFNLSTLSSPSIFRPSSSTSTLLNLVSIFVPASLPSWPVCPSSFQSCYPSDPSVPLHSSLLTLSSTSIFLSVFQSVYLPCPFVRLPVCLPSWLFQSIFLPCPSTLLALLFVFLVYFVVKRHFGVKVTGQCCL